ncbi:MAG TPA: hypothetical protein VK590_09435 [Saprospiraceae bacterium]|nr:hypothetical protein [Saprospiraceae bacterium]
MIDDILSDNELDYFKNKKPIEPIREIQDSSFPLIIFDPETYEETKISKNVYNTIYFPKSNKEYNKGLKLWNLKEKIGKRIIIVSSFGKSDLKQVKNRNYNMYPEIKKLLYKFRKSGIFHYKAKKISINNEYLLLNRTNTNLNNFKYSITGYFWFSDVILSKQKDEAIVLTGTHYNKRNDGIWGWGVLYHLRKDKLNWKIVKTEGIWEE